MKMTPRRLARRRQDHGKGDGMWSVLSARIRYSVQAALIAPHIAPRIPIAPHLAPPAQGRIRRYLFSGGIQGFRCLRRVFYVPARAFGPDAKPPCTTT